MTDTRYSEDDLRGALRELAAVDADDVAALRTRFDTALAAGDGPGEGTVLDTDDAVLDLVPPTGDSARRGRFGRRTVVVAAVTVAAAAAVVAVVLTRPADRADSPPAVPHPTAVQHPKTPSSTSADAFRDGILRAATVVQEYDLHGPQQLTLGSPDVPPGYELQAVVDCTGPGQVRLSSGNSGVLDSTGCSSAGVASTTVTPHQTLTVAAPSATRWRLRIAVSPQVHTNATMYSDEGMQTGRTGDLPADDGGTRIYTGAGNSTFRLTAPTGQARVRYDLRCTSADLGHGVRISGTTQSDLSARPCVQNLTFTWDHVRVRPTQTLRLTAPADVHWQLNVLMLP